MNDAGILQQRELPACGPSFANWKSTPRKSLNNLSKSLNTLSLSNITLREWGIRGRRLRLHLDLPLEVGLPELGRQTERLCIRGGLAIGPLPPCPAAARLSDACRAARGQFSYPSTNACVTPAVSHCPETCNRGPSPVIAGPTLSHQRPHSWLTCWHAFCWHRSAAAPCETVVERFDELRNDIAIEALGRSD